MQLIKSIATWEYLVVGLLVGILLLALIPAVVYARREQRDGIGRNEVIQLKYALERYNNEHGKYPLTFEVGPHQYVVEESDGSQAISWYLRAQLENPGVPTAAFDYEHNVYYRVVRQGDLIFYDICGGISRCGAPPHQE